MKGFLLLILFSILLASSVSAATISGNVYDLSLNKVTAVVNVDSVPKQSVVAKDGSYKFTLGKGTYSLNVKGKDGSAEEILTIDEEGDFTLDLVLFPDDDVVEDIDIEDVNLDGDVNTGLIVVIIVLGLIIIIGALYWKFKPKEGIKKIRKFKKAAKKEEIIEEEDDLKRVLNFIRKAGGRTTQKDIRKEIGLSEAKISLMITELEDKNKVKRIKKGRGNIIILVK